ncbi:MAG: hypothetical protein AAFR52_06565, partial [Pseudomonadota bacterium]
MTGPAHARSRHLSRRWSGAGALALLALLALLAVMVSVSGAAAQLDLPAGALRTGIEVADPARTTLVTGPGEEGRVGLEGHVAIVAWQMPARGLTPLGLVEELAAGLEAAGFERRFDCADAACGGVGLRFAIQVLDAPAMRLDTADMALATLERPSGPLDEAVHTMLVASRLFGTMHLQMTHVGPTGQASEGEGLLSVGGTGDGTAVVTAPRTEVAPEPPLPVEATAPPEAEASIDPDPAASSAASAPAAGTPTAERLAARLGGDGRVVLEGVDFASGGRQLLPGAEAYLDAAA